MIDRDFVNWEQARIILPINHSTIKKTPQISQTLTLERMAE